MLVLEPTRRYTIEQIKRHRWMCPEILELSNIAKFNVNMDGTTNIEPNEDILRIMGEFAGIPADKTKASLKKNSYDHVAAIYLLLQDRVYNKKMAQEKRLAAAAAAGSAEATLTNHHQQFGSKQTLSLTAALSPTSSTASAAVTQYNSRLLYGKHHGKHNAAAGSSAGSRTLNHHQQQHHQHHLYDESTMSLQHSLLSKLSRQTLLSERSAATTPGLTSEAMRGAAAAAEAQKYHTEKLSRLSRQDLYDSQRPMGKICLIITLS